VRKGEELEGKLAIIRVGGCSAGRKGALELAYTNGHYPIGSIFE
jgi:hypothetical protein